MSPHDMVMTGSSMSWGTMKDLALIPSFVFVQDDVPSPPAAHSSSAATHATFSLSHAFSVDNDAIIMTNLTLLLTFVLELASASAVRQVCRNKEGAKLYVQGILYNLVNNCVLGPLAYEWVNSTSMSPPLGSTWDRAWMVGAILLGHAIGYYCAHRWMHTRSMYWAHRFHHRFNAFVVPVTANAVSLAEYTIAYMAPFVLGSAVLRPDRCSLFIAVGIISLNNLLIHTPFLADLSERYVPWLGVSTADHLEHHRRLTTFYAAPTISVDRILMLLFGKPKSWNSDFDDDTQIKDT